MNQSLRIAFLVGVSTLPAWSAKVGAGLLNMDQKQLYLYVEKQKNHHAAKVEKPDNLSPNRVHMKYDTDLHRWIYTKTDFAGKLTTPLEALRPDTVVPGSVIGAELALQRFILESPGTWLPTANPEVYHVWVKTTPPQLQVYRYAAKEPPPLVPKSKP